MLENGRALRAGLLKTLRELSPEPGYASNLRETESIWVLGAVFGEANLTSEVPGEDNSLCAEASV